MKTIHPPFFEIGPKSYLYGDQILQLALAADAASQKYGVDVIFTTPYTEIRRVAEATRNLFVFAPHMDSLRIGRGLADVRSNSGCQDYMHHLIDSIRSNFDQYNGTGTRSESFSYSYFMSPFTD